MSQDFYVTEDRTCARCGYRIDKGTVARYDADGKVIHSHHAAEQPDDQ